MAKTLSCWFPTPNRETPIRSFSKMAACAPIRFRARNPTACTARRRSWIRTPSFGPIRIGRASALADYILYELHVGTFTPEGTFAGAISKLDHLKDLGITAIELMPVGEFPGARNWGYDQVDLYAPHSAYGGPDGLKSFVDACHQAGLAVVLDVVYNHVGPEGNYLGRIRAVLTPITTGRPGDAP